MILYAREYGVGGGGGFDRRKEMKWTERERKGKGYAKTVRRCKVLCRTILCRTVLLTCSVSGSSGGGGGGEYEDYLAMKNPILPRDSNRIHRSQCTSSTMSTPHCRGGMALSFPSGPCKRKKKDSVNSSFQRFTVQPTNQPANPSSD